MAKISEDKVNQIVELKKSGRHAKTISKELGITKGIVELVLKKDEIENMLPDMRKRGMTYHEISKKVGLGEMALRRLFKASKKKAKLERVISAGQKQAEEDTIQPEPIDIKGVAKEFALFKFFIQVRSIAVE